MQRTEILIATAVKRDSLRLIIDVSFPGLQSQSVLILMWL